MWRISPRILPAMIFVAVLGLGVRAGDIWTTLTTGAEAPPAVPAALAQTREPDGGDQAEPRQPERAADPAGGMSDGPEQTDGSVGAALTPEMIESLVKRRRDLERRERALDEREAFLVITEKRVDDKLAELQALKGQLVGLLDQLDEERREQIESLVKIYAAMKPKDAARILENLDRDVLLDVVENMQENKIAPILAEMDSEIAKEVTASMARRRQLPDTLSGG